MLWRIYVMERRIQLHTDIIRELAMRLCLLVISQSTLKKPHQYKCPKWAEQKWQKWPCHSWEKAHVALTVHKKLQTAKGCWGCEKYSSPVKSMPIGYPIPKIIPKNTDTSDIKWSEQVTFRNIYTYSYMYTTILNEKRPWIWMKKEGVCGMVLREEREREML